MVSPESNEWPTDPYALACIASDLDHPGRGRAAKDLQPIICRIARRVACRFGGQYREDLVAEALAEIWKALKGFQPGNSFEAWGYRVLRNHLIDRFRKDQRERELLSNLASSQVVGREPALERALDRQEAFTDQDLHVLRDLPLVPRLALLSLSGLWEKVPKADWDAWIEEYPNHRDGSLELPFPPAQLRNCQDIRERNAILSEAMRIRRNTLSVWLHRYKERLLALPYVHNLLDNT